MHPLAYWFAIIVNSFDEVKKTGQLSQKQRKLLSGIKQRPVDEVKQSIGMAFDEFKFSREIDDYSDDRTLFGWFCSTYIGQSWNPDANKYATRALRMKHL